MEDTRARCSQLLVARHRHLWFLWLVKGFHIPCEDCWWVYGGSKKKDNAIIEEPVTPPLTLLHVAAILCAVSRHSPGYMLTWENCWHYA